MLGSLLLLGKQWRLLLWNMDSRARVSVVVVPGLWSTGSVIVAMGLIVPRHVRSAWTGDQTSVSCIGRQVLCY